MNMDIELNMENGLLLPVVKDYPETTEDHLSDNMFAKYIDVLLFNNLLSLLGPNMCEIYSKYLTDYFVTLDFVNFKYKVPTILRMSIDKCKNSFERFYILPLRLYFHVGCHSNIIIIDNEKRTIEFFEPHGNMFSGIGHKLPYNIQHHIRNLLASLFPLRYHLYEFINTQSCKIGIQTKSLKNPSGGYCLAWSILIIHLRMLNISVSTKEITEHLLKKNPQELDTYIKRYISYLGKETSLIDSKLRPTSCAHIIFSNDEKNNIKTHIEFLVSRYKTLSSISNKTPEQEKDLCMYFEELITYRKCEGFHDIFFNLLKNLKRKRR